jgi:hypothetical protein
MTESEALELALTSLGFADFAIRDYPHYPSEDTRNVRLVETQEAQRVIRSMIRQRKS